MQTADHVNIYSTDKLNLKNKIAQLKKVEAFLCFTSSRLLQEKSIAFMLRLQSKYRRFKKDQWVYHIAAPILLLAAAKDSLLSAYTSTN